MMKEVEPVASTPILIPDADEPKPIPVEQYARNTRLAGCIIGIMSFFLLYGVLQERIMLEPYGKDDEGKPVYFKDTTFLVFSNRVFAAFVACIIMLYKGMSMRNVAPLHKYFGVAMSNFSATWCQYEALKYVNFPTQTLGKCGKMFPVMVVGTLVSGKKYTGKDYVIAVTITAGCMIFLMTGDIKSKPSEGNTTLLGLFLMALYMFFDGFTSTFQEKMFKGYTMSTYDQMIYVNACSASVCIVIMLVTGTLGSAIRFSTEYPRLLWDSTLLSFCSTFGQMVIYYTIKEFGALVFSTVMVTRQVVSILLSCIIYVHPLTLPQWAGVAMVFGSLYYKALQDQKKHAAGGKH